MRIGIPKEIQPQEKRVAATPRTVAKFINLGFDLSVESSAGENIFICNEDYEFAGARIVPDAERLFTESDIVLKVNKPEFNNDIQKHEVNMLRDGCVFVSGMNPESFENREIVRQFKNKNITAISLNQIPETTDSDRLNARVSMNMVTGYKSVIMAANHLPRFVQQVKTANGSIGPARFLIVGAGEVGLQAIATAKQLGGNVKALDTSESACIKAKKLGAELIPFYCPDNSLNFNKGYTEPFHEEWLNIERNILEPYLDDSDIVILSANTPGSIAPILITEQMITTMKPGSVIVDTSIEFGGNCEVTVPDQIIQRLGIYVYGIRNIPGMVAQDASMLYAENIYNFIARLFRKGIAEIDINDAIVKNCLITCSGHILNGFSVEGSKSEESSMNLNAIVNQ